MFREIELELQKWRDLTHPHPLLIRGARQVGKSFTVEKFAQKHFDNYVCINFEYDFEFYEDFATLDPHYIINQIFLKRNIEITTGRSLIFLDEIQLFPKAIQALRYFYEKIPGLHVIAAGSLVDFALKKDPVPMPVGRVHYLYMHPLSFREFLKAQDQLGYLSYIETLNINNANTAVHEKLLGELKNYLLVGGMPAVVREYLGLNKRFSLAFREQKQIINSFIDDFRKYAKDSEFSHLRAVFENSPLLISKKYKYSQVDPNSKSQELKNALELLMDANIFSKVRATSGSARPLELNASDSDFKVIGLDCGLVQNIISGNNESQYLTDFNSGLLAEQLVGQEMKAYEDAYSQKRLYYWFNDVKNASAEIDYLIDINGTIIPVEVKAASRGKLKSLRHFMDKFKSPIGLRISANSLSFKDNILSVPLYAVSEIARLIKEIRE